MTAPLVAPARSYGLLARFEEPETLIAAVKQARTAGYKTISAYTPFPVEGLPDALGKAPTRLPFITLAGGVLGGLTGYGMQWYACVISYPMNVGGRPDHSWPSFIPIIFELTILGAAVSTVLGILAINGLPMPYHPLFAVPEFDAASRDRFFLVIESRDPQFDLAATREFLAGLAPSIVLEVPR